MILQAAVPHTLAVVPVLIGPLSTLLALLPAILLAIGSALLTVFKPGGAKKIGLFFWHQKLFTCLLATAIWFIFWGPQIHFWPGKYSASSVAEIGMDWTAFRGGPARRGAVPGGGDPTLGEPVWAYTKDKLAYASPTVVGDRVYLATVVSMSQFATHGAIVCLNAESGEEVWRYAPRDFRATFSSPAVCGDYLVCGEGLHWDTDARIICLDLKNSGKLLWEFRTQGHVESSPCIYKDKVYIGAGMDGYYCVGLKPDAAGKPVVRWHLDPKKYKDCETPPLLVDDVMYAGFGGAERSDKGGILALSANEGRELWRVNTPYPVFSPPAFDNGKLYIGMGIGDFVNDAEEIRKNQAVKMHEAGRSADEIAAMEKETVPVGEVWCIDVKSHQCDWKFRVGRTVLGAVVPGENGVYFGSRDGNFYCVSKEGKLLKKFNAHEPIVTSPALGAEHVYFATMSGRMFCMRSDSLERVWDMPLGSGIGFMSSPALARGHIFIGTANDGLRCIGRVGEKQPPLWRGGERGGVVDTSFLPPKMDLGWRYPMDPAIHFVATAPLLPHAGFIYAAGMRDDHAELIKLKPDRVKLDDPSRRSWTVSFNHPISVPPAAVGDEIYVADGDKGRTGRAIQCLSAETGASNWRFELGDESSGCFTLDRKRLFVWSDSKHVSALDRKSGQKLWTSADVLGSGDGVGAPTLSDGLVVLATQSGLCVLDDATGKRLWVADLKDVPKAGPVLWENSIIVETEQGVELHDLTDGSLKWKQPVGKCSAPPVVVGDSMAVFTTAGDLIVLGLRDGTKQSQTPQAISGVPPISITPDSFIFRSAKDLTLFEIETGKQSRWYGPVDWLGQSCTPLVFLNQQLYFGSVSKGVVCLCPKK